MNMGDSSAESVAGSVGSLAAWDGGLTGIQISRHFYGPEAPGEQREHLDIFLLPRGLVTRPDIRDRKLIHFRMDPADYQNFLLGRSVEAIRGKDHRLVFFSYNGPVNLAGKPVPETISAADRARGELEVLQTFEDFTLTVEASFKEEINTPCRFTLGEKDLTIGRPA